MFRYFTYAQNQSIRPYQFLPEQTVNSVVPQVREIADTFVSIQSYTAEGECIHCPVFADFDHKDLEVARRDIISLSATFEREFDINPDLFFSGNRGFHFEIPYQIQHPRCGEVVREMINYIKDEPLPSLDQRCYSTGTRIWRVEGSYHSKTGLHKTKISKEELYNASIVQLKKIATYSEIRDDIPSCAPYQGDYLSLIGLQLIGQDNLPIYSNELEKEFDSFDLETEMTPCIKALLKEAPEGQTNNAAFLISRFLKSRNIPQETARRFLLSQEFYSEKDKKTKEITKVLRSVYTNSGNQMIGCKGNNDAASLMRNHCESFCHFADDYPAIRLVK